MRHSLDLSASRQRRIILVYSRRPYRWWRFRRCDVATLIYDDPFWLDLKKGGARVVRRGWPYHNIGQEEVREPSWPHDLAVRHVVQEVITDDPALAPMTCIDPFGVEVAKGAIGVRSIRLLSAYQLYTLVEDLKKQDGGEPA